MSRRSKQPTPATLAPTSKEPGAWVSDLSWSKRDWLFWLALALLVFTAYHKVWSAGFVWDDDAHVIRPNLRTLHGLGRIWSEPGATQQYYPFLYSAFWVEHRWWGDSALGYHLINLAFHSIAAGLLYQLLKRLAVPGAFLAATIFALHPVCVESVAWISEQKNTLSTVLYLSAALVYLRYDQDRSLRSYLISTGLFLLALASKSVTATLPAALLVVFWWKRGRLEGKRDVLPLIPWFLLGVGAGALTAWMEHSHVGASGSAYGQNVVERGLIASRAICFYFGKFIWPADLMFNYPRWAVNAHEGWQYLFPIVVIAVVAALWTYRHRSRAPLAVTLVFIGTLFPALGFINVFPFLYSYVADHFQYLGVAWLAAATGAALALATRRWATRSHYPMGATLLVLIPILGGLTRQQTGMYFSKETLWRTTLAQNPESWMAYNNLGGELLQQGRLDEAVTAIETSIKIAPENAAAHVNLGNALWKKGDVRGAFDAYQKGLSIEPDNLGAHLNLGNALLQTGRVAEAIDHYQQVLSSKPDFSTAHTNLGDAFLQAGRIEDAINEYHAALENNPRDVEAHANLGAATAQKGSFEEAIGHFRDALKIDPNFTIAHTNWGNAELQSGHPEEAINHHREVVKIAPTVGKNHTRLADTLARVGRLDEAVAEYNRAVEIDANDAEAQANLGTILAQRHETEDAIAHLEAALKAKPDFAIAHTNLGHLLLQRGQLDDAIAHYQEALKSSPNSTPAKRGLAMALAQKAKQATPFPFQK